MLSKFLTSDEATRCAKVLGGRSPTSRWRIPSIPRPELRALFKDRFIVLTCPQGARRNAPERERDKATRANERGHRSPHLGALWCWHLGRGHKLNSALCISLLLLVCLRLPSSSVGDRWHAATVFAGGALSADGNWLLNWTPPHGPWPPIEIAVQKRVARHNWIGFWD